MSKLNLLLYINASSDRNCNPTNAPLKQNFKWERSLNGIGVENPSSLSFSLAPSESITLWNGQRTLTQDTSTQYSLAPVPSQTSTYQLTWSGGTNPTFRTARTTGADATTAVNVTLNGTVQTFSAPSLSNTYASFTGKIAGMATNVTITANNLGVIGNSVLLTGDGTSSISTLITAWNAANVSNHVTLTSGDGTQIPTFGGTIALSGGHASATPFNLISGGVVVGDFVTIGNLFNVLNQGQWQIIALTATSFSVVNAGGVAEGPIILGSGFATQVVVYSAAGVQIGDILNISGGFSPVSWGSYVITAVTNTYVQFSFTGILPTEGPITTEAIAIYFMAKSFIYLESDQNCSVTINGTLTNNVMPIVPGCCYTACKPGILMISTNIHTLTLLNTSTQTANLFLASVE